MRGRLRSADQLRRRYGLAVPLLIRYDDYLVDIAENRILKAATSTLLTLPGVAPRQLARLRQLRMILSDVADLVPRTALPRWQPSRLNARYQDALWLAAIILAGGSVEQEPGLVRLDGFLVDLFQVFEDFVTASLSEALERFRGSCHAQEPHSLDEDGAIDIRPDLVWRDRGGVVAVIDAKYKAEKPAGFPQADLYQALAYAIAHDLDGAHLVYARGNEAAQTWTVRHAGVRITAHTLDLDAPAEDVLIQVSELARRIAATARYPHPVPV
jgi:5-methylcytosine-specific restriction enzyme subunit McrC